MRATVTKIEAASSLRGKVSVGDRLIRINGTEIIDVLDYKYLSYDADLLLTLETPSGGTKLVRTEKCEGEDLGLEFESYLMDSQRACTNHCVFCFVDQLPRGMRKTLYFKDDDARLSFLTGNYITLTNLSEREISRIIALKISPINVSVHATEPTLRARLLGSEHGGRGYEIMQGLAAGGITMNCQIVCCPGLNDGDALKRSMGDLSPLYPQVNSVSIVPVGLTKHREKLPVLKPFGESSAREAIDLVEAYASDCLEAHGSRIFFCADELYLKAGRDLPREEYYEGYPQLENGVGMLTQFETEFMYALAEIKPLKYDIRPFSIATGVSAAPFLKKLLLTAAKKCGIMNGKVFAIANDFFGHTIDVAGLVTGGDLIAQLRGKNLGARLLIPANMLRHGEGVFLDGITVEDVEHELDVPVTAIHSAAELLKVILGS